MSSQQGQNPFKDTLTVSPINHASTLPLEIPFDQLVPGLKGKLEYSRSAEVSATVSLTLPYGSDYAMLYDSQGQGVWW